MRKREKDRPMNRLEETRRKGQSISRRRYAVLCHHSIKVCYFIHIELGILE